MTYKEKLQDPKWKEFSDIVKNHYGNKCWSCGSEKNLQSHHKFYKPNTEVWDYKLSDMVCLCNECHKLIHKVQKNSNPNKDSSLFIFVYEKLNDLGEPKVAQYMQDLALFIYELEKKQIKPDKNYEKEVKRIAKKWKI